MLLEEFEEGLTEHIVVYLNEQTVNSLSAAAFLAARMCLCIRLHIHRIPQTNPPQGLLLQNMACSCKLFIFKMQRAATATP